MLLSDRTRDLPAAQNLFVVQGELHNPTMLRAHMPTSEADQRPVQENFAQLGTVNQRLVQHRAQERFLEQQGLQEQRAHGPVPTL
ncbi:XVIPCD domain-containing protein [Xanthomonas arboricola]|uniref:XVIPCD domain-containing protein n=1 Tax=Xanthomonas arboricola TaxID=56448 RepID=UPI003EB85113